MFDNSKIKFFEWPEFHYIELNISISVSAIEALNSSNEVLLRASETNFQRILQKDEIYNNLKGSDQANYFSQCYEYSMLSIEDLKKNQRYSTTLLIFSFLESQLNEICELICEKIKIKIKRDRLKSIIQNYYDFLINELKIKVKAVKPLYVKINKYKTVRNIIAHGNGIILKKKDLQLIKDLPGVSIIKRGRKNVIELAEGIYVKHLLAQTELLLKTIVDSANEKIKSINP